MDMRFAVLGTGRVGPTIASKLVALGHEVTMGSREAANERAAAWVAQAGPGAAAGTFADAAAFGDIIVNATEGSHALDALQACGADLLSEKILIDVTNPLDFSAGFPPRLTHDGGDSLGEQIQRAFPQARVVKTLNTMNCDVMVDPSLAPGGNVFIGGDDPDAKQQVRVLLQSFGWPDVDIVDLGDITSARGAEAYVLFWVRLMQAAGIAHFNIRIVRGE
jgi:predicted dinucleotide-binding enzyme